MLKDIVAWIKATVRQNSQTRTGAQRAQAKRDKSFYRDLAIDGKRRADPSEEQVKGDEKNREKR